MTVARGLGLADPFVDGLHQVLEVWEDVGIGLVAVLSHHFTINDDVKLAVRAWRKLKVRDVFSGAAQRFSCHPGSAEGVASIPTIKDFQFQLFSIRQSAPPHDP